MQGIIEGGVRNNEIGFGLGGIGLDRGRKRRPVKLVGENKEGVLIMGRKSVLIVGRKREEGRCFNVIRKLTLGSWPF